MEILKEKNPNTEIGKTLYLALEEGASDVHLNANSQPILRVDGKLKFAHDWPSLKAEEIEEFFKKITTQEQRDNFYEQKVLDFSHEIRPLGRFRVNALMQKGVLSLSFRVIAREISPLERLGLPSIYEELSLRPRGLILVTGPTGSGKSTTLAAMINHINETESRHIMCIEDPIEYVHPNKNSIVLQMDVGEDTKSFSGALANALRHDPDVIVVGEMRDLPTIATAITAAETGHLVMGTLHTIDAAQTIDRVVDVFPNGQQEQIRTQLSQVLVAVLSQSLVPCIKGGRIPACEIMIINSAIRNNIREGQIYQIPSSIQLGVKDGMQTLNQALASLITEDTISKEEAMLRSSNPEQLRKMLERQTQKTSSQRIMV